MPDRQGWLPTRSCPQWHRQGPEPVCAHVSAPGAPAVVRSARFLALVPGSSRPRSCTSDAIGSELPPAPVTHVTPWVGGIQGGGHSCPVGVSVSAPMYPAVLCPLQALWPHLAPGPSTSSGPRLLRPHPPLGLASVLCPCPSPHNAPLNAVSLALRETSQQRAGPREEVVGPRDCHPHPRVSTGPALSCPLSWRLTGGARSPAPSRAVGASPWVSSSLKSPRRPARVCHE